MAALAPRMSNGLAQNIGQPYSMGPQQGAPPPTTFLQTGPIRSTFPNQQATPTNGLAQNIGQPYSMGPQPTSQQGANAGGTLSNILSGLGISNASPLQPGYMNNPPMVNPATLGQNFLSQFNPSQSLSQILNYAAPMFQKAQSSLNDQLAAAGMFGGPAANATGALNSQLLSSIGPMLAQSIMGAQGNMLNAGEFNANALNQGNYFNAQNVIGANQYNTNAYNNSQNNLWNSIMQGWSAPFNAYNQINLAGLTGAQNLAGIGAGNSGYLANSIANNFPVNTSSPYGGLGTALGGLFAQAPTPSQPAQPPSDAGIVWA